MLEGLVNGGYQEISNSLLDNYSLEFILSIGFVRRRHQAAEQRLIQHAPGKLIIPSCHPNGRSRAFVR